MFTFTLLTPGEGNHSCKASLLTIDNDVILADPSWNGKNHEDMNFLEDKLQDVSAVLLSHSTPEFLSGFILLCIKFPVLMSNIKIYATSPICQLGRVSTVEFYRSVGIIGPLKNSILEVEEVDEWFDKVIPVKYSQTTNVLEKLVLTPYNSGHTLGGSFWLIAKKLEKIIYAPSWNHSKDSFLNAASFISQSSGNPLSQLMRPTALITSTDLGSSMPHKRRTEKFLQLVDATLSNGGTVLLPTSLSGRFLELLHLIDQHLQSAPIPVLFLSYSGANVLRYTTNLLDWMSHQLSKELENANSIVTSSSNRNHYPFDPSKVDLIQDPTDLQRLTGPKIIFTSGLDIRGGEMSCHALKYLCQDDKTTILLTEKTHFGYDNTINGQLYQEWVTLCKQKNNGNIEDGIAVPLEKIITLQDLAIEEDLTGSELIEFRERINLKRKQKLVQQVRNRKAKNLLSGGDFESDESEEDEDEDVEDEDEDIMDRNDDNNDIQQDNQTDDTELDVNSKDSKSNNKGNNEIKDNANGKMVVDEETKKPNEEANGNMNLFDDAVTQEALVTEKIKTAFDQVLPLDIQVTNKLRPRHAMFPYFPSHEKQDFDDYGAIIDHKKFEKKDDLMNSNIGLESKRRPERRNWGNDESQDNNQNKLTPQEILNNDIIKKNLDTLFQPRKRIAGDSKYSSTSSEALPVRCGLAFVDLSGLVDLRSLGLIISSLKPSNLLLLPDTSINGAKADDEESNGLLRVQRMLEHQQEQAQAAEQNNKLLNSARFLSLASIRTGLSNDYSSSRSSKMEIFDIKHNGMIKIGNDESGINIGDFEVKLDDSIIENLKWQRIDGSYRVSQVYGQLELHNPQQPPSKKQKTINDYINQTTELNLRHMDKQEYLNKQYQSLKAKNITPHQLAQRNGPKLSIGNVRLPELKKRLLSKNLDAEFKGEGTLVVNDTIAISKVTYGSSEGDDTGDIVINGSFGPLYYQVKESIRELLAYV